MKKIRWGVLGAAGIADRRSIPGLVASEHAELAAVMEIDAALAEKIRAKYGCKSAYTNEEALIADPDVEAVYIASPVAFHARQALACIAAKKPFLIEKPLALDAATAKQIADAADAAGLPAACGLMMRFGSWHQVIRDTIRFGKLGTVVSAKAQFTCWYPDMPGAWRQKMATSGGGSLMDMGVHCIDLIQYALGSKAVKVAALIDTRANKYDIEDEATILFQLADGTHATVEASFCIPDAAAAWRMEFAGTKGTIVATETLGQVDGGTVSIKLDDQGGYNAQQDKGQAAATVEGPANFGNMYGREFDSFSLSLLEGRAVEVPLADAVQVQRVVEAAYESAKTGRFVSL
jgi:predicted dehydrogenase